MSLLRFRLQGYKQQAQCSPENIPKLLQAERRLCTHSVTTLPADYSVTTLQADYHQRKIPDLAMAAQALGISMSRSHLSGLQLTMDTMSVCKPLHIHALHPTLRVQQ